MSHFTGTRRGESPLRIDGRACYRHSRMRPPSVCGTLVVALSLLGLLGCAGQAGSTRTPTSAPPNEAEPTGSVSATDDAVEADELVGTPTPLPEPDPEPPKPEPIPPLPEGTVVLHVGSSSAGALGLELNKELKARGIKGVLKAKESTFIPEWAGEKMGLRGLLATYKPDLVIVSLGGNETQIPDPTKRTKAIQRLVKMIGDRPCVWVGTPRWKRLKHTGLLEVIEENAAPCRFIDSDELIPNIETLKDGVHPTYPERSRWAKRLIQWLEVNRDPNGETPWSLKEEVVMPEAPEPQLEADATAEAR